MDRNDLAVAGDLNLAAAWASLARHGGSAVADLDGITLVSTGLQIAFFNGAFVRGRPSDAARAVDSTLRFYSSRAVPYLVWAREPVARDILSAGRAAGLRNAGATPAMGLPSIGEIPPAPHELKLRLAATPADLDEHRTVMSKGFGIPMEIAQKFVAPTIIGDAQIAAAIGSVDGVAVVTALLFVSGESAGVYNVATLPEHRGKGYGAAATWAVVAEGARRGCTHSVLQASKAGYSVYQRMGYLDLGQYTHLEGPPAS